MIIYRAGLFAGARPFVAGVWMGRELSWLERTPDKREVVGSTPTRPTIARVWLGALAQLGERLLCKHQVIGSIPIGSTSSQRTRRFSEAKSHAPQERPALRSAPQGAALLRLTARRARDASQYPEMKTRDPLLRQRSYDPMDRELFDIVNGFFKSMPWRRRFPS